jgi:hypothetical protein
MKCTTPKQAKQIATKAVGKHKEAMHKKAYASGGPVCRGMGAAERGGKYSKNG